MIRGRRLVFAQTMDALTFAAFYVLAGAGSIHAERNPLVLALMAIGGIQAVILTKIGLAWWIGHRQGRPFEPSRWAVVRVSHTVLSLFLINLAIAAGIVGAGFNTAAIVDGLIR